MSSQNIPCKSPSVCNVKTHRPGTVTKCTTASSGGSTSNSKSQIASTPSLAAAPASQNSIDIDIWSKAQVDELNELLNSGESQIEGCTDNELNVLKNMGGFEYMDAGIRTASTWGGAFADGVAESAEVAESSVGGIVGSLVKKGYVRAYNDGSDDMVDIQPKGIAAYYELNPEGLEYDRTHSAY